MIVIMAGLPATGKSTLARLLASHLSGIVIDKDSVRAALFAHCVDYIPEQDDLTMECVFTAVRYMARAHPAEPVFIDGRPFVLKAHLDRALEALRGTGAPWRMIETVCSDETARERLLRDPHLAANRTFELYRSLKARRETITVPKLTVDTDRPIEECLRDCLAYLAGSTTAPDATPHPRSDPA